MKNLETNRQATSHSMEPTGKGPSEEGMRINGLQQVVDLLKTADPAFRDSLLKRLTQRDPQLAQQLKKVLR
jgi:hypothetical protein